MRLTSAMRARGADVRWLVGGLAATADGLLPLGGGWTGGGPGWVDDGSEGWSKKMVRDSDEWIGTGTTKEGGAVECQVVSKIYHGALEAIQSQENRISQRWIIGTAPLAQHHHLTSV